MQNAKLAAITLSGTRAVTICIAAHTSNAIAAKVATVAAVDIDAFSDSGDYSNH